MRYFIFLVLILAVGSYFLSIFLFKHYIKPDIEDFNRKMLREHPEYFKAPEANRLGKGLQHPY